MDTGKICPDVLEVFENESLVKICAPMVRYSKLQFRQLVRNYDCNICYTPMIIADSFCKSLKARNNEFTTNILDTPLIIQFAANTVHDFVNAAHLSSVFCSGVDLNCGCPQRWAKDQGLGCVMLENPQTIFDITRQCRNVISKPFTVSVKMRISKDSRKSVEICKQLEKAGASYLTVHARTPAQITGNINVGTLKLIKENVTIPIVANGGIKSLEDCIELQETTRCNGVMVANGILQNPTLFTGSKVTPVSCVQRWIDICYNTTLSLDQYHLECQVMSDCNRTIPERPTNLTFQCFHHHLVFMLEKVLSRCKKQIFNNLQTFHDVLTFLYEEFDVVPHLYSIKDFTNVYVLNLDYQNRENLYSATKPQCIDNKCGGDILYDSEKTDGEYFRSKTNDNVEPDSCDWANLFLEND